MSTKASAAALVQAAKDLSVAWQETREQWRDTQALHFGQDYLDDLPNRMNRALAVMNELDTLFAKIHNDCE